MKRKILKDNPIKFFYKREQKYEATLRYRITALDAKLVCTYLAFPQICFDSNIQ